MKVIIGDDIANIMEAGTFVFFCLTGKIRLNIYHTLTSLHITSFRPPARLVSGCPSAFFFEAEGKSQCLGLFHCFRELISADNPETSTVCALIYISDTVSLKQFNDVISIRDRLFHSVEHHLFWLGVLHIRKRRLLQPSIILPDFCNWFPNRFCNNGRPFNHIRNIDFCFNRRL